VYRRHRAGIIHRAVAGEDAAVQKVGRAFIDGKLEVSVQITGGDALVQRRHQPVERDHFHHAFQFAAGRQPQAHRSDRTEATVAAHDQTKKFLILDSVAATDFTAGIDEGERLDIVDHGPHGQAAPMGVGREGAAQRQAVRAGLFLADGPDAGLRSLLGMEPGDQFGPGNARARLDESALAVHPTDVCQMCQIQQQRAFAELLAAHGVARAAKGDRESGPGRLAHGHACFISRGRQNDPRHLRGVELGMDVIDGQRGIHDAGEKQ